MLVGIAFVAILTGALAERFLAAQIEENQEILEDVEQAESDVLVELRDITERLQRLERRLGSQEA
jgi:hypothetical protein